MCSLGEKRDIYGFGLVGLSHAEINIREECLRKTQSSLGVWLKTIKTKDVAWFQQAPATGKLKTLIRRSGIPFELRPEIWMALSGAKNIKASHSTDHYEILPSTEVDEIDTETATLFRFNAKFGGKQGLNVVSRILAKYRCHRPGRIDTVQGVTAIIAFLIVVLGHEREEDVFWIFDSLIENKILNNSPHEFGFNCQIQEGVLKTLLLRKNPNLHDTVVKFGSLSKICNNWFSSLFVLTLPSETAARVWDCLFSEGSKILLRVALALMNKNQNTISSMIQSNNLPKVLTYKMRRTIDANELLSAAFYSVGSMPSSTIQSIRKQTECVIQGKPVAPVVRSWRRLSIGPKRTL
eukprot:g1868.t1